MTAHYGGSKHDQHQSKTGRNATAAVEPAAPPPPSLAVSPACLYPRKAALRPRYHCLGSFQARLVSCPIIRRSSGSDKAPGQGVRSRRSGTLGGLLQTQRPSLCGNVAVRCVLDWCTGKNPEGLRRPRHNENFLKWVSLENDVCVPHQPHRAAANRTSGVWGTIKSLGHIFYRIGFKCHEHGHWASSHGHKICR